MKHLLAVLLLVACASAADDATKTYFKKQCSGCHTIGGGHRIGPDLKHVGKRKAPSELVRFLNAPVSSVPGVVSHAQRFRKEPSGETLHTYSDMTPAFAQVLADFVNKESAKSPSDFPGTTITNRKFSAAEVRAGSDLFMGSHRAQNGGPSCASCHTVAHMEPSNALGPDLTQAITRLKGRNALATYLANPPADPMAPVYQNAPLTHDEIAALVAYLEDTAKRFK